MAMMFFSCGSNLMVSLSSLQGNLTIRTTSMTTKTKPTLHRSHIWKLVWPEATSSGSSPSASGRVPPMRSRKAWTTTKEAARPMTSFSVSDASSSHFFSHSSSEPSRIATLVRMACVTLLSKKTLVQAMGKQAREARNVCGSCSCNTAKVLIAAKPVKCPSRMPPVLRFSSTDFDSSSVRSRPPLSLVPERKARTACRNMNQARKWATLTKSSKISEGCSPKMYDSTMPLTAWKSSTAEKIEIVELMTIQEYFLNSSSFWLTR
mmetsp:Transcript_144281/g.447979  ORF Transcript_144281/g.447979 Transcript_144281/m.447979 type:complete len:263 (-) Transcript_144281:59-847(-)